MSVHCCECTSCTDSLADQFVQITWMKISLVFSPNLPYNSFRAESVERWQQLAALWLIWKFSSSQSETLLLKPSLIHFWLYIFLASGSSIFSSERSGPPWAPATVISSIMSLCQANRPATVLRASFLSTDIISQKKKEIKNEKKFIHFIHQHWPTSAMEQQPQLPPLSPPSLITLH